MRRIVRTAFVILTVALLISPVPAGAVSGTCYIGGWRANDVVNIGSGSYKFGVNGQIYVPPLSDIHDWDPYQSATDVYLANPNGTFIQLGWDVGGAATDLDTNGTIDYFFGEYYPNANGEILVNLGPAPSGFHQFLIEYNQANDT
jgi:hypothetical protein